MKNVLFGLSVIVVAAIAGCAAPPASLANTREDSTKGDSGDDATPTPSSPAKGTAAAPVATTVAAPTASTTASAAPATTTSAPPAAPFSVTASAAHRMGDDNAQGNAGTSLEKLSSLVVVHVPTNTVVIHVTGADLDAIKSSVGADASLSLNFPGNAPSGQYVLMDDSLYYPGEVLALTPGTDLEHWAKGIIGYLDVTSAFDSAGPAAMSFASDIIWSGWELGELAMGHVDRLKSPLVLDLAGNGVTFDLPRPVFDIDGDGARDSVAWVSSANTPFLVRDRNHNGRVDGIDEMFGDGTHGRNGTSRAAKNGFEALAEYDLDGNGIIDAKDPVFHELGLWFDENHDGVTDAGEIEPLGSRHVSQIALDYVGTDVRASFGNRILQKSEAITSGGRVAVYDVWFSVK